MEKIKILVFGANGMAGHVISKYLTTFKEYKIIKVARETNFGNIDYKIDVTNFKQVEDLIYNLSPNFIINAVGILNKFAETNPDQAILLNSYFPHFLFRCSKNCNCKFIHISTDCVFDGEKGGYSEFDQKNGKGFYAQSKALGEVLYEDALTIRTSIIGPELKKDGIGLFNWVINQKNEIKGYKNAFWSGVTTYELAKFINYIIINKNFKGLIHLTNNIKISKFDLISIINEVYNLNLKISPDYNYTVDKSLLNTRDDLKYKLPSYKEMIKDLKEFISN